MLWRHGDVLIASVDAIPTLAKRRMQPILAYGEVTGHAHRIEQPATAEVWELNDDLFLRVLEPARIVHEEHLPISLPVGTYRVWQQREYTPAQIVRIKD